MQTQKIQYNYPGKIKDDEALGFKKTNDYWNW